MFLPSTKQVWDVVEDNYSDIQNSSLIYVKNRNCGTQSRMTKMHVSSNYIELMNLCQEFDLCFEDNWKCFKDINLPIF